MKNPKKTAKGNKRFIGFMADLIQELATRLDFYYEMKLVADGKWGSRDQYSGQWNGMIGEIIRGVSRQLLNNFHYVAL